jgi:HPt (histidine-containing phosphotransfer) domain-containing protein
VQIANRAIAAPRGESLARDLPPKNTFSLRLPLQSKFERSPINQGSVAMSRFRDKKTSNGHAVAALLDEQQINALMAVLGARSPATYALFFAEVNQQVDRMRTKILKNDREAIAHEAHALRSSAATFGCTRISEVAGKIEARADVMSVSTLRRYIADIDLQLTLARPFLTPRLTAAATTVAPARALALS